MRLIDKDFLKTRVSLFGKSANATLGEHALLLRFEEMIENSPEEIQDHSREHGAWIEKRNNANIPYRECSKCGRTSISTASSVKYCQYCGAYNDTVLKEETA